MQEILPGIYLLTLSLEGFNPDSVNTYIIKTDDGLTSIDTGLDSPPSLESMNAQLAEIGAVFSDINQIIITHSHIDHLGLIARFRRSHPVRIIMHEKDLDLMRIRFAETDHYLPLTDRFLLTHGTPASDLGQPDVLLPIPEGLFAVKPDILLYGGEKLTIGQYNLEVIPSPGHSPGHIALYEPERKFIFSGDMLLPTIATNAAVHVQHMQNPLKQYADSLATLKKLDIDLVLPGHEHVYSGPGRRIEDLLRKQQKKSTEIFRIFQDRQPRTAYQASLEIARSPVAGISNWSKLLPMDRRFAVLQTISHLEALKYEGKLKLDIRNGIHYYCLNG